MPHLTLINGIMAHPATDILGATIITATWWLLSNPVPQLPGDGSPNDLFIGLSTLSGLVMATATFICTMLYQSNSPLMIEARKRFPEELSRNWLSIIIWTLTTAILPLFSLCLWGIDRITSFGIVIFSTSLLLAKGGRSIYWLNYTLFMEKASSILSPVSRNPKSTRSWPPVSPHRDTPWGRRVKRRNT